MLETQRLAQLPMYDWPEFTQATDCLWTSIRHHFSKAGINAPTSLDRTSPPAQTWQSAKLLLSQTCGLPLVADLSGKVKVLGSFAYQEIEPAGSYHSVIISQKNDDESDSCLEGKRAVINGDDSYSGCLALKCYLADHGLDEMRTLLPLSLSAGVTAPRFVLSREAKPTSRQSTASVGIWPSNVNPPSRTSK